MGRKKVVKEETPVMEIKEEITEEVYCDEV